MSDTRQGWLETELSRQLHPISAPDSLWDRIHEQRRPLRVRANPWKIRSIAAAALLALLAGLVWRLGASRGPGTDLEALAQEELRAASNAGFLSDDPGKIQAWVRANSGIDIRLPDRNEFDHEFGNDSVRLMGVRLLRTRSVPVAVVTYEVGGTSAALLVTNRRPDSGGTAGLGHVAFRNETAPGTRLYSWSAGANDYALAFGSTKDAGRPCLLCHAATPALMILE